METNPLASPSTLTEALAWLDARVADGLRPRQALAALDELRGRYPGLVLDLVWEEEAYSGFVHYDLLLTRPDGAVISLALTPPREVPWPLRHATHVTDGILLRVNGHNVELADAVSQIELIDGGRGLLDGLVDTALARQEVTRRGLRVSEAELAAELDRFRRDNRLFTADETLAWLDARGFGPEVLEDRLEAVILERKLRDSVVGAGVEAWLDQHGARLDTAAVLRVRDPRPEALTALRAQIEAGATTLAEAAVQAYTARGGAGTGFATLRRGALPANAAAAIFGAAPGDLVGPLPSGDGFELIAVLSITRAERGPAAREAAADALFDAWLRNRRAESLVEWFWNAPAPLRQVAA